MENDTAPQFTPLALTPEALRAEADALAREEAPRRFAVFAMNYGESDGVVIAWGQLFKDGHVALTGDVSPVRGSFNSLRSALRFCERGNTATHVTWIDPEPVSDRSAVRDLRTATTPSAVRH